MFCRVRQANIVVTTRWAPMLCVNRVAPFGTQQREEPLQHRRSSQLQIRAVDREERVSHAVRKKEYGDANLKRANHRTKEQKSTTALHRAAFKGDIVEMRRLLGRTALQGDVIPLPPREAELMPKKAKEGDILAELDEEKEIWKPTTLSAKPPTVAGKSNPEDTELMDDTEEDFDELEMQYDEPPPANPLRQPSTAPPVSPETVSHTMLTKMVNAQTVENGYTPLHRAAVHGFLPAVQLLVEHGAALEATTISRKTALHIAVDRAQDQVAEFLLSQGASTKARTVERWTPLHIAARLGHVLIVNALLEKEDGSALVEMINATDRGEWAPVHYAIVKGHTAIAGNLLDQGADVEAEISGPPTLPYRELGDDVEPSRRKVNHHAGCRPLHLAVRTGQLAMVKLVVAEGADVNAADDREFTALHYAAQLGGSSERMNVPTVEAREIVEFLIQSGASLSAKTDSEDRGEDTFAKGYSALHIAVARSDQALVVELLEAGADPLDKTVGNQSGGKTAFHLVTCPELFDLLRVAAAASVEQCSGGVQRGDKLSTQIVSSMDTRGFTPLHCAAQRGAMQIAERLLVLGASLDARTHPRPRVTMSRDLRGRGRGVATSNRLNPGSTPLQLARIADRRPMIQFLKAEWSRVNGTDDEEDA